MYAGRAMERGDRADAVLPQPYHPYTRGPARSRCRGAAAEARLDPDRGAAAEPDPAPGRAARSTPLPVRVRRAADRDAAAARHVEPGTSRPAGSRTASSVPAADGRGGRRRRERATEPLLLEARGPRQALPRRVGRGCSGGARRRCTPSTASSLEVRRGETLGLVGETGCGKSTLARCMTRLYDLTAGAGRLRRPRHLARSRAAQLRPYRLQMQMIFQDPYGSLNPRRRVGSIIGDPFAIHGIADGAERKRQRAGADGARRAQPRALQPVPGRVLRRPAPAHRRRAGAGAAARS